jgi:hypothetical protein
MTVSVNNGNTDLDYARKINAFEADPNATPEDDARLEAQFSAAMVQFLGNPGTKKPFTTPLTPIHLIPDSPSPLKPIHLIPVSPSPLKPIHLIPDSPPGGSNSSLQPMVHEITDALAPFASLSDPNVEPRFDGAGLIGTMGVPSNFNLFPNGDPSPEDVDQHGIGDCFLA